jgi:hypothetical protein
MTFEQAIKYKAKLLADSKDQNGFYTILVTPVDSDAYEDFITANKHNLEHMTDDKAKEFTLNDFTVKGYNVPHIRRTVLVVKSFERGRARTR